MARIMDCLTCMSVVLLLYSAKGFACELSWSTYSGKCYLLEKEFRTWYIANNECVNIIGAEFVKANEEGLLNYLSNVATEAGIIYPWIGLHGEGDQFIWQDKSILDTAKSFWDVGEPADVDGVCVYLNTNTARWVTSPCSTSRPYFCAENDRRKLPNAAITATAIMAPALALAFLILIIVICFPPAEVPNQRLAEVKYKSSKEQEVDIKVAAENKMKNDVEAAESANIVTTEATVERAVDNNNEGAIGQDNEAYSDEEN